MRVSTVSDFADGEFVGHTSMELLGREFPSDRSCNEEAVRRWFLTRVTGNSLVDHLQYVQGNRKMAVFAQA